MSKNLGTISRYSRNLTLFENYLNCSIWIFIILAFSTNFCPIKSDMSGNTVWPKALVFKCSPKSTIIGIFNTLLSAQNVNVAGFARNVKWDFCSDFHTPCDNKGEAVFTKLIDMPIRKFHQFWLHNSMLPFWKNSYAICYSMSDTVTTVTTAQTQVLILFRSIAFSSMPFRINW